MKPLGTSLLIINDAEQILANDNNRRLRSEGKVLVIVAPDRLRTDSSP